MLIRKSLLAVLLLAGSTCLAAMAADPSDTTATKAGKPAPVPHPTPPRPTPPTPPPAKPADPIVVANVNRNQAMNHLKELAVAIMFDESTNKHLPQRAIFDKDGKPLLSWRVRMLPYLEGASLYEQFHLDEPWDSEHNKKLVEKMPEVFNDPQIKTDTGMTVFQAVVGPGMAFEADKELKYSDITDGTSNTIGIVEVAADKAVPWTKPADWEIDVKNPSKGLAMVDNRFLALYLDGHIDSLPSMGKTDTFLSRFTRAAGDGNEVGKAREKFDNSKKSN